MSTAPPTGPRPIALIVGAGGGLGDALCRVFGEAGWEIVSTTRNDCDLASPDAVTRFLEGFQRKIDLCIFAAATLEVGRIRALPLESLRRSFEVNAWAPIAFFRSLNRKEPSCNFIFIFSGTAKLFLPGLSAYSLSKRLLFDFFRYVEIEEPASPYILKVWPGGMRTPLNEKAQHYDGTVLPKNPRVHSPDDVARKILDAYSKRRKSLVLSRLPLLLGAIQQVFPALIRTLFTVTHRASKRAS